MTTQLELLNKVNEKEKLFNEEMKKIELSALQNNKHYQNPSNCGGEQAI